MYMYQEELLALGPYKLRKTVPQGVATTLIYIRYHSMWEPLDMPHLTHTVPVPPKGQGICKKQCCYHSIIGTVCMLCVFSTLILSLHSY